MSDLDLNASVDALVDREPDLPLPAVRRQLRLADDLTQRQLADALHVKPLTILRWEGGQTEPRRPWRDAYARLLQRLAEKHPEAAQITDRSAVRGSSPGMPTPPSGSRGSG
ncbi:helix-turn-helix domain-containing protein [Streptomyces sp. IBSNAI002]|uniref:helix-turn-helix domain-containing protein n=1 Tax=Streptomyces sp. IBSNAI002 TaxID=3457500 RepID=UPI003FD04CF9